MLRSDFACAEMNAVANAENEACEIGKKLKSLDEKFDRMYEDRLNGLLSERKFRELAERSETEREKLTARLDEIKIQLESQETAEDNISHFMEIAEKYTHIRELDAEILNRLIDRAYEKKSVKPALTVVK